MIKSTKEEGDIINLFELVAQITLDSSEYDKEIDKASDKGKSFGEGFGKVASGIGKTLAAGIAVGATAIAGLSIKALALGGDLEQAVGGSEAVFAKFSQTVQDKGVKAFENMGLSMTDFLATSNKMGALFQGAGFTIEESMNLSTEAMQRSADVASIMGIDVTSAMEAVAGAAKGNFTMMDNLGVAMNATTIEAYALSKGINTSYNSMSNQQKIGLAMELFMEKTAYATGNYAKENETLAGSLNTTKAALTNFLSGATDAEGFINSFTNLADVVVVKLTELLPRLITGLAEVVNNLIPRIPEILGQLIPSFINGGVMLVQALVSAIPQIIGLIAEQLPLLLQAGIDIFMAIVTGLTESIPSLIPVIIDAVLQIVMTLIDNLPMLIMAGIDLILALAFGLIDAIPQLIAKIPEIIDKLITALTNPEMLNKLVMGALQLIIAIAGGLIKAIPELIKAIPKIIGSLVTGFGSFLGSLGDIGLNILKGIINGFLNIGNIIMDAVKKVGNSLMNGIKSFFGIHSPSTLMYDVVGTNLGLGVIDGFVDSVEDGQGAVNSAMNGIFGDLGTDNVEAMMGVNGIVSTKPIEITLTTNTNLNGEVLTTAVDKVSNNRDLQYTFA